MQQFCIPAALSLVNLNRHETCTLAPDSGRRDAHLVTTADDTAQQSGQEPNMTDPARHQHPGESDDDTQRKMSVSEDERRMTDPTKEVYGAFDEPDEAIHNSDPARTDGPSLFEVQGGEPMPDTVPGQPYRDGIGPFSSPIILIVALLVIFVVLLVVFG